MTPLRSLAYEKFNDFNNIDKSKIFLKKSK